MSTAFSGILLIKFGNLKFLQCTFKSTESFCKLTLLQHEKALHALANALLEYETLNAEEIKQILLPYSEGSGWLPEQQEQEEAEGDLVLV